MGEFVNVLKNLPLRRLTVDTPGGLSERELSRLVAALDSDQLEFGIHYSMGSYRTANQATRLIGNRLIELELGGTYGWTLTERKPVP